MKNEHDVRGNEIVRQSRNKAAGSRMQASSGGTSAAPLGTSSTRVDSNGNVRDLFILDFDILDDPTKYLGGSALIEDLL